MRILVTFAVEAEFAPWRTLRAFQRVKLNEKQNSGGVDILQSSIGGNLVWVFFTGIGIRFFEFGIANCLLDAGVEVVISSGLAGALKPKYVVGDVLVPKAIGDLRDITLVSTTEALCEFAERRGAISVDALLTSNRIVETGEEKTRLSNFGDAVDMESLHVMREFRNANLPVVTIRAISDASDDDLPLDFSKTMTSDGRIRIASMLKQLAGRPTKIPALVRFGQQSRKAACKLTEFLDGFVGALTPEVLIREQAAVVPHE